MLDPHWRRQTQLCNPCAVNYDYIINFSHLANEGERLLQYLQVNNTGEKVHLPRPQQIPVDESEAKKMFRFIDQETTKNIEKYYHNDFYLFNYDPKAF